MNKMYIPLSLTDAIGVRGAIIDRNNNKNEIVAAWLLVPEHLRLQSKKKFSENTAYPIKEDSLVMSIGNLANCYLDKEIKIVDKYKGFLSLYINSNASFKSASLDRQYFLIKKGITDENAELKRQFKKALKKLPLPIHEDWEEFFWLELSNYFKELDIIGKVPYQTAFVMELPKINELSQLVETSHKSSIWKKKFKRVPQIKSLILGISDIENFDLKKWQKFLERIGGKNFLIEHSEAIDICQAYEILGDSDLVMSQLNTWYKVGLKEVTVMIKNSKDKNEKARIRNIFLKLFIMFKDHKDLIPVLKHFNKIYKEQSQNIINNNIVPIKKFLDSISYDDVEPGAEVFAAVCAKAKIEEKDYKTYETEYLENLDLIKKAPRNYPTIKREISSNLEWELLDMSSPEAWVVGEETHCCMTPRHINLGWQCVLYAAYNPEKSGILRLSRKGKTIAQSFMWIENGVMCLDSIERTSSKFNEEIVEAYHNFAEEMAKFYKLFQIHTITVGAGHSYLGNLEQYSGSRIPNDLKYTDANKQHVLRRF
jgi:hypothetical protein